MNNRKATKPMKRVTLTVDPDDYDAINDLAKRSDVSASWLIRRAMREFLESHNEQDRIEIPNLKKEKG